VSEEFISNEALEAQFKEAMAPAESGGRLIITGLDINSGQSDTDVYRVTDVATPTEEKTVLLVEEADTGEQYKFTFEYLGEGKNNGE
jgi:hypothetical protein